MGVLKRSLPPDLQDEPLRAFDRCNTDVQMIERCLDALIAQANSSGMSKADLQLHFASSQAGKKALKWYIDHATTIDIGQQPVLIRNIVFCLVAEGAEALVWQWKDTHDPMTLNPSLSPSERRIWKGSSSHAW